jgi:hypothetical protein
VLGISLEEPVPSPVFSKPDEIMYGYKSLQHIAQPVIFKDKKEDIMMVI